MKLSLYGMYEHSFASVLLTSVLVGMFYFEQLTRGYQIVLSNAICSSIAVIPLVSIKSEMGLVSVR